MTVAADQNFTGLAEAFEVNLVADAVAGFRAEDAVLVGDALQVPVIVGVLEAVLQGVVVDVRNRAGFDTSVGNRFVLQVGHRAEHVLRQGLVDANLDFSARFQFPGNQVCAEDFFKKISAQFPLPKTMMRL